MLGDMWFMDRDDIDDDLGAYRHWKRQTVLDTPYNVTPRVTYEDYLRDLDRIREAEGADETDPDTDPDTDQDTNQETPA